MISSIQKISGIVVKGKQKGRKLGFPTANLALNNSTIQSGVYVGKANFAGGKYTAAIFVPDSGDLLEAHILDFQGDLYGQEIEIEIGQKIREVMKFENKAGLIKQISKDLLQIRKAKS
ncbi:MAG: riboflavin kinase [Candidatus Moranbacteria bacterium]|nr:riboflavin kinase [Candidatus Moranbacteria bacterium]